MLQHTPGRKKKRSSVRMYAACAGGMSTGEMSKTARGAKCAACGREFITDRAQKYCSHACYIAARFEVPMGMKLTPAQFDREAGYRFSLACDGRTARKGADYTEKNIDGLNNSGAEILARMGRIS